MCRKSAKRDLEQAAALMSVENNNQCHKTLRRCLSLLPLVVAIFTSAAKVLHNPAFISSSKTFHTDACFALILIVLLFSLRLREQKCPNLFTCFFRKNYIFFLYWLDYVTSDRTELNLHPDEASPVLRLAHSTLWGYIMKTKSLHRPPSCQPSHILLLFLHRMPTEGSTLVVKFLAYVAWFDKVAQVVAGC